MDGAADGLHTLLDEWFMRTWFSYTCIVGSCALKCHFIGHGLFIDPDGLRGHQLLLFSIIAAVNYLY